LSFSQEAVGPGLVETVMSYSKALAEQTQVETVGFGMLEELVELQTLLAAAPGIQGLVVVGTLEFVMVGTLAHAASGAQDQTSVMLGIPETTSAQTTCFHQETAQLTIAHLLFVILQLGTFLVLPVTALTLAIALTGQHLLLDARPVTHNTSGCSSQ
jgi:hypothetical protein